jgi:hypothetical protein
MIGTAIIFLSSSKLDGFILDLRNSPGILSVAAIVAGMHGLLTAIFLIWKKSDFLGMTITGSILSMMVFALSICIGIVVLHFIDGAAPNRPKGIIAAFQTIAGLVQIFLYISVFLAVPGTIIGFINHFISARFK